MSNVYPANSLPGPWQDIGYCRYYVLASRSSGRNCGDWSIKTGPPQPCGSVGLHVAYSVWAFLSSCRFPTAYYLPTAADGRRKRSIGSPNRMYVRRVSGSLIFDLASLIASPKVKEGTVKSSFTRF